LTVDPSKEIERGFVMVFRYPKRPSDYFIKRVIGLPGERIKVEHNIRKKLKYKKKIYFIPHHLSHASASYYTSFYERSAVLTIDGVGEYQSTVSWQANKNILKPIKEINFPNSLGLFYSAYTAFLGFRVNNDEYKVMGLAACGKPKYTSKVYKTINVKADGSFKLKLKYFGFEHSFQMWTKKLENLLGKPRKPNNPITQKHKDLANSLQTVFEEIYFKILNQLYLETKITNLCIGGGVALNSLANGKIYTNTPFKKVHIFGPSGDSGAAIGSALYTYYNILHKPRQKQTSLLYLGNKYSIQEIKQMLDKHNLKYTYYANKKELIKKTAQLLANNKIIGWFQDKIEFGPRALGHRSILANPKQLTMKDKVNLIKRREFFRPFAASVLQEHVHKLFEVPEKNHYSPFMNFCFQVKPNARKLITSIVHADNSCRIQTVNKKDNSIYYDLIKEFYKLTKIPCVLNTSFNLSHEPIVENPEQAILDLIKTKMDGLVIDRFLVLDRKS